MHGRTLHEEFSLEQALGRFSPDQLALALMEEIAQAKKISTASFEIVLQLIAPRGVAIVLDIYPITSALVGDTSSLTEPQLSTLRRHIESAAYDALDDDSRFALCDAIINLFDQSEAEEILKSLDRRSDMHDGVRYAFAELHRMTERK
jgi:hypothetical protein